MNRHDAQGKVCESAAQVRERIAPRIARGERLVTTNGCFDILHAGHVSCLAHAASLGEILVVGVNADATVRRLKGEGRPLQSEGDRVLVLASLMMVDYAFLFHEEDPRAFVTTLRPHVHVKGGDYPGEIIEGATVEQQGGKVVIVPFVAGRSTTRIVEQLRCPPAP